MTHAVPLYRLVSPDLFRTLMKRTWTGAPVSIRILAGLTGVPRSTIGNLLTGDQKSVSAEAAHAIAYVLGVEAMVLWQPERLATERSAPKATGVGA